jgi:hypothetical protein
LITPGLRRRVPSARVSETDLRWLWQPALTRAVDSDAAVYDTLFVELAAQRSLFPAAFDKTLLDDRVRCLRIDRARVSNEAPQSSRFEPLNELTTRPWQSDDSPTSS